ncbi:MAG: C13 family peptidase [Planktomarina sp.]
MRIIDSILATALLAGCTMSVPPVEDRPKGTKTYLYAQALYGEPVFDNDVETFAARMAQTTPISDRKLFGFTSSALKRPTGGAESAALNSLADQAVDGRDVVVAMLTTHGNVDVLAVKVPGKPVAGVSADAVANFLSPLNNDRQVIILQACYSGSLIDELAHPNRIILTAAADDRSSFGCRPNNTNTWFIESLNTALAKGGSWASVFEDTKNIVRAKEESQGIGRDAFSNPMFYIGSNMQHVWRSKI